MVVSICGLPYRFTLSGEPLKLTQWGVRALSAYGDAMDSEVKTPKYRIPMPQAREIPKEIHVAPCKSCPSAHHGHDPMSLDFIKSNRETQLLSVFPCAWRPTKLCKGWCDAVNITEKDLV